jgi:dipeptide transport system permease protein
MTMTTPASTTNQAVAVDQSLLYPSPYKEFWQAFSKNKGAVAGLMFMLLVIFCAISC